ncbi:hypothetical protein FRX31_029199 [Thalictrum thalictroides]|uniref:Uncharacterized protein n=1 Tax=Thalictrum thalictroides TaxID=46969 RepID=A0A7J6V8V3_THATH|nr:hypothetical protein FRX31_029199 [Thalictrum thalictroides]
MGSSMQENDVLKLVHPGGFVEFHTKPLTAAQVMKNNPRHCVTRPDVFKFPWIVVRPDSVLKLGTVYFIVPNYTLYRLLRASGVRRQPMLDGLKQPSQFGDQHSIEKNWTELTPEVQQSSYESWADATPKRRDRRRNKQTSQVGSCDEETPKNEHHRDKHSKQQYPDKSSGKMVQKKQLPGVCFKQPSCFMIPTRLQDRNQHPKRQSRVKHSIQETLKHIHRDQHLLKDSSDSFWDEMFQHHSNQPPNDSLDLVVKPYSSRQKLDGANSKCTVTSNLLPKQDLLLLKSCLRKAEDNDHSKSHGRKVRFLLPSEEDKIY